MTDKEYQTQQERVRRYAERWLVPLGLDTWHVEYCWHREKDEDDPRHLRPSMMETEVRWQYQDARIHIYLPSVLEVSDDTVLEKIMVHEYMHIYLHELRPPGEVPSDAALGHEEHAATILALAFLRTRDHILEEEATLRRQAREGVPGTESPDRNGEDEAPRCEGPWDWVNWPVRRS